MAQILTAILLILSLHLIACEIKRLENQFSARDSARLVGSAFAEKAAVSSAARCSALCARHSHCVSFNYAKGLRVCELNQNTSRSCPRKLQADGRFKYYEIMDKRAKEPTTEVRTTEEPITEVATTEVPTTEEPATVAPSTEVPTTEEPTTQVQTTEAPTTVVPTNEEPTTEEPTTVTPSTEVPITEKTTTEVPTTKEPTTEVPTNEEPTTEVPTTEAPTTVEPTTVAPSTEVPTTEKTTTEVPTTDKPTTETQTTEEPTTEVPTTEEPITEVPTTEEPTTETQTTEEPIIVSDPLLGSCSALKQNGYTTDGYYMIDPDGTGSGEEPFRVFCSSMTTTGWTTVDHTTSGQSLSVTSDPFEVTINYMYATENQIQGLLDVSTSCNQFLKAECRNAKLWDGDTQLGWWVSGHGGQMDNWGGVLTGSEGCSCYNTGTCAGGDPTARCNCGGVPDTWTKDEGRLNDRNKLPVAGLRFEQAGPPNELMYKLDGLTCYTKYPSP